MPSNEYIKRSDAVFALCGDCLGTEACGMIGTPCDEVEKIKAIPAADAEPKQRWIPITTRPMSEDERKDWSERLGYDIEYEDARVFTSQLPNDGEEVLKCNKWGDITVDTFRSDDGECYFDYSGDMEDIVAWMPLPKPYEPPKGEENAEEQTT